MQSSITQNHLCMSRRHNPPPRHRRSKRGKGLKKKKIGHFLILKVWEQNPGNLITITYLSYYQNHQNSCILATWILFAQKFSVLKPKNSQTFNFTILHFLGTLIMYNWYQQFLLKNLLKLETAMPKLFCISSIDQYHLNHKWNL